MTFWLFIILAAFTASFALCWFLIFVPRRYELHMSRLAHGALTTMSWSLLLGLPLFRVVWNTVTPVSIAIALAPFLGVACYLGCLRPRTAITK